MDVPMLAFLREASPTGGRSFPSGTNLSLGDRPWQGQPVVPLILQALEREPDHWFWALEAITGANPVREEERGRIKQMAAVWVPWGRENGYRW
jgi:hypothetical protein